MLLAVEPELPDVDDWAKFLEKWAKKTNKDEDLAAMAVYRQQLLDWEGYQVRNLMIGVLETARYIESDTVSVLAGLSSDTMRNFFRNTISPIDHIYAFSACGVAAFNAALA